jgi:hypothetical protein
MATIPLFLPPEPQLTTRPREFEPAFIAVIERLEHLDRKANALFLDALALRQAASLRNVVGSFIPKGRMQFIDVHCLFSFHILPHAASAQPLLGRARSHRPGEEGQQKR